MVPRCFRIWKAVLRRQIIVFCERRAVHRPYLLGKLTHQVVEDARDAYPVAAAMLDGLADRVEAELGQPLTVVATGGLAPYIMPCCKRKIIYDADLLFKGLALIWERNGK